MMAAGPIRKRVRRMVYIIAAIYVAWCVLLYTQQDRMMFPRDLTNQPVPEAAIPRTVERVWLGERDRPKVEAWFIRSSAATSDRGPAVMIMHGNAELIDDCLGDADRWTMRGYHVMIVEYRGYGRSEGTPAQDGIVADMQAGFDLLTARPEVDSARVIVHGRSLGAAVAAQLAASRPVAGVVLESPFRSATAFAMKFGAPPFLVKNPFRTDRALAATNAPVLILHSINDEVISIAHGRGLKKMRPDATLVELTGGHNSGLSNQTEYWDAVDAWRRTLPGVGW